MKKFHIAWFGILLFSCDVFSPFEKIGLDELSFGDQSNAVELFVTGGLTSELAYHRLKIEKPGSILNRQQSQIITDAIPYIICGLDTIGYELIDDAYQPYYKTSTVVKAELGKKYTLHIEYNGKLFTATDSMVMVDPFAYESIELPSVVSNGSYDGMPEMLSLILNKHSFGYQKANIWVWLGLTGYKLHSKDQSYLKNNGGITYSHWASDPNAIFSYYSYSTSFAGYLESDTLITAKYSISDGYYQFLISLFSETDWKQGEFATQPGNLHTNFSQGAAGYFFVSDYYEKQIIMSDLLNLIE